MPELTGKDLVVIWVTSGGTATLTTEYQKFSYQRTQDKFDLSRASDTDGTYLLGIKNGTAKYSGLALSAGTALSDLLALGTYGTITVAPEGTASGKRKFTFPAFTTNDPEQSFAFNELIKVEPEWQFNGAVVRSTY